MKSIKIQPTTTWKEGKQKQVDTLKIQLIADDLKSYAIFKFILSETEDSEYLVEGTVELSGVEYEAWDGSNVEACRIVVSKIGLTTVD